MSIKNAIDELQEQRRRNEAEAAGTRTQTEAEFKALTPMVTQMLRELGDRRWGRFPARALRYRLVTDSENLTWTMVPRLAFLLKDGDRSVVIRLAKRRAAQEIVLHFQVDVCDERVPTEGVTPEDLEQALSRLVHWLF